MNLIGQVSKNAQASPIAFVDPQLSLINETNLSSNLKAPPQYDTDIGNLANAFDNIDPTQPKESLQKLNESMAQDKAYRDEYGKYAEPIQPKSRGRSGREEGPISTQTQA